MKKVIEYKLMTNIYSDRMNSEINKLLKEGWELYGTPFATKDYWAQSLVKYEEIEGLK